MILLLATSAGVEQRLATKPEQAADATERKRGAPARERTQTKERVVCQRAESERGRKRRRTLDE
jgi:hypothetical protein